MVLKYIPEPTHCVLCRVLWERSCEGVQGRLAGSLREGFNTVHDHKRGTLLVLSFRCSLSLPLLPSLSLSFPPSPSLSPTHPCHRHKELTIHGLGAAINRAINLALQLKETSPLPMEVCMCIHACESLCAAEQPANGHFLNAIHCSVPAHNVIHYSVRLI